MRLCCSQSELAAFLWKTTNDTSLEVVTRILRGTRMCSEQDLFDEISAAWQFPYYFGNNWNALDECLADLEWLPADAYVFALSDFNLLLTHLGETVGILLRLLANAAREWSTPVEKDEKWDRPGRGFHVLLHSVPEHRTKLVEASELFQLDCPEIELPQCCGEGRESN